MSNKRYDFQNGSKCAGNVRHNRLQAQKNSNNKPKVKKSVDDERDRKFCLSTYINVQDLEKFLRSQPWISHWCYTSHHSDVNEDGTIKDLHTHVLLYTHSAKTASGVKKNFDRFSQEIVKEGELPQNTLCQICHDMVSQYRYQLHLDDKNKFQYSFNERFCDDISWWQKLERTDGMTDNGNTCLAVIQDIQAGATSMELAERYGKDYVYHIPAYKQFFAQHNREVMMQEMREMHNTDISQYFNLLLEGSPFQQDAKNCFFMVLDYIKSECQFTYDSKLNFYLEDKKC